MGVQVFFNTQLFNRAKSEVYQLLPCEKWLFVEGVVVELRPDEASVLLAGAGKKNGKALRVSASYPDNRKQDFAALKKGDTAKIKGVCGGEFLGVISLTSAGLVK